MPVTHPLDLDVLWVERARTGRAIELLGAILGGATDVRGAPIDPVARRLRGVPTVLNGDLGDDVGLIIAEEAVTVDYDGTVDIRGRCKVQSPSPRTPDDGPQSVRRWLVRHR